MIKNKLFTLALVGLCVVTQSPGAHAQVQSQKKLTVGTKEIAPFCIKNADGSWSGISVDLWQQITAELNLSYEFRELDLQNILEEVQDRTLDTGVAAITITPEREEALDFTHPYYTTGLGIAVAQAGKGGWLNEIRRYFSLTLLKVVLGLALLLLLSGFLVWLVERKRNPEQFGGRALHGIGSAFWWSAVTMTTVGYGDKAPVTAAGRLLALIWMFAGIIMISSFTAAITSALTVSQLDSPVEGPEDLPRVRAATIAGSTSEVYLRQNNIFARTYESPLAGLTAVVDEEVDAMVYDEAILRYVANTQLQGKIRVLPETFEKQYYGIALPENSALREPINRVLLEKITEPQWQNVLYRYLGR